MDLAYGRAPDLVALSDKLAAALVNAPDNPDLHEVAAALAALQGDRDLVELHALEVALDVGAVMPELGLHGLDPNHPLVVETCRLLAAQAADPGVQAAARHLLLRAARLRGDDRDAQAQLAALGTLGAWRVIGAFDNDEGKGFLARYPPEQRIDPDRAEVPGELVPVRWRRAPALTRLGEIPFEGMVWPNRQAVAYAVTFLRVPSAQEAALWLTSEAPIRVFLDGQVALSRETQLPGSADNLGVRIQLQAGPRNTLS